MMSYLLSPIRTKLIDLRLVARVLGLMCLFECFFLLLTLAVSGFYGGDDLLPFAYTTGIMLVVGSVLYTLGYGQHKKRAFKREGFLIVTGVWLLFSLIGMLPFLFGGYTSSVADAFFETMSGFTTTGATIFPRVEHLPHGILFWRSIIQWQGGIGIVVFTMALLPLMLGDAVQLFDAETTGIMHDRFLPRIKEAAKRTAMVYLLLTVLLILLLWAGPVDLFESICHAFSCVSTGGLSTRDGSVAEFNSPYVEYVITIFMILGSLSISQLYFVLIGRPKSLLRDEEFHWFMGIIIGATLVATAWLLYIGAYPTVESNFRHAMFQVVTFSSSTGYLTADIVPWGQFFWVLAIFLMFVCGCSGSTSGGFKVSRLLVLFKNLRNEFEKRIRPNIVAPVRANGIVLPSRFVSQVLAFFFIYLSLIFIGFTLLCLDNLDFAEAISASVSCIGNAGPALGKLATNYADITATSKWVLSFLMLAGRLEIFTVLVILHPAFWRK